MKQGRKRLIRITVMHCNDVNGKTVFAYLFHMVASDRNVILG